jgi:uncharacterized peroxidase-related enzyme
VFVKPPEESAAVTAFYEKLRAEDGYVMNFERIWAWRPEVSAALTAARMKLNEQTSLAARERAVLVCATARTLGDSYCALAWGTRLAAASDPEAAAALLETGDAAALTPRERALARWARRVVDDPNAATAGEVADLVRAGLSEQEVVDATIFVALRVAFSTVNDALGARPDAQLAAAAPGPVRRAVRYGRPVDAGA